MSLLRHGFGSADLFSSADLLVGCRAGLLARAWPLAAALLFVGTSRFATRNER